MKKNTKIFIGVIAVAVVAYFLFFKRNDSSNLAVKSVLDSNGGSIPKELDQNRDVFMEDGIKYYSDVNYERNAKGQIVRAVLPN